MPATALEQLQLELVNEARLNPMASAARYITSFSPLTSNVASIQQNFDFHGVVEQTLLNAFKALKPVQPLAWNESLGNAADAHNAVMIAVNQQTHKADGEADMAARAQAAG